MPLPPDHLPPVAATIVPFRIIGIFCWQTIWSKPAFALIGLANAVTVTVSKVGGHPDPSESWTI